MAFLGALCVSEGPDGYHLVTEMHSAALVSLEGSS